MKKNGKLSCLQGNFNDKNDKSAFTFFQPLLNLSENWLLATGKINLSRTHEKFGKLSSPQGNVNVKANAKANANANFNCNSQPFIIERLAKKGLKFFILEICVTFKTIVY